MNKCNCYNTQKERRYTYTPTGRAIGCDVEVGVCRGTKEVERCNCGGDKTKCDFYSDVREKANKEKNEDKSSYKEILILLWEAIAQLSFNTYEAQLAVGYESTTKLLEQARAKIKELD